MHVSNTTVREIAVKQEAENLSLQHSLMGAYKQLIKLWLVESQRAISTDPALIREVKGGAMPLSRGRGRADIEVDEGHPTSKIPLAPDITEMC